MTEQEIPPELVGTGAEERQPSRGSGGGGLRNGNGGRRGGAGGGGSPGGRTADASPASVKLAESWSKKLEKAVSSAKKAVERSGKKWTLGVLCPDHIGEAFGPMRECLRANKQGAKNPCPRLFTCGNCRVSNCRCSHNFAREPTNDMAKRFLDWVEGRCGATQEDPSKA